MFPVLKIAQKFLHRITIAKHKARTTRGQESKMWAWLGKVMDQLGHDGMSSEDSEIEDQIDVVLRVHAMPWRQEMSNELAYIDSQRVRDNNIFGRQGMRPMKRIRGQGRESTREPVQGLPLAFYNQTWLNGPRALEIKMKETPFTWMTCVWLEDIDRGDLADSE
jgi:hypothetical protein